MQAPMQKDSYKGIGDFAGNALGAYYGVQEQQREKEKAAQQMMLGKQQLDAGEITNKYLERLKRAEIGKLEADAQFTRERERKSGGKAPALSNLAKHENERREIDAGFIPGTNGTQRFGSPDEQARAAEHNEMAIQKLTSDVQTRNKALFAENVIKTMDSTDVDALTAFSGAGGGSALAWEKTKDPFGGASEKYKKYQEELSKVKLEAKEIRQFFGDSIREHTLKALEDLTNPTSWGTSPEVAKRKIKALRDVIKKQLETYTQAVHGKHKPKEMSMEESNAAYREQINDPNNPELNQMVEGVDKNGNKYKFPLNMSEEFVREGGRIL